MVRLSNGHLVVDQSTITGLFGETTRLLCVYYPNRNTLLLAGSDDELFKSIHKTTTALLKLRNEKGDRSISVLELILDYDLDDTNRQLEFEADTRMKVLNVYFGTGANFNQT
ncbi:MAG: hypothetical protein JNL59_10945 [Chitinophagaceae bacterium]|jgi:hypothetical protein|nr:hypothetical protein [Chitinophagaceae bacterium]